jgi:hypothetical protein
MALQGADRGRIEAAHVLLQLGREAVDEVAGQRDDVFLALAQPAPP